MVCGVLVDVVGEGEAEEDEDEEDDEEVEDEEPYPPNETFEASLALNMATRPG